jgi:hypothetical protein
MAQDIQQTNLEKTLLSWCRETTNGCVESLKTFFSLLFKQLISKFNFIWEYIIYIIYGFILLTKI